MRIPLWVRLFLSFAALSVAGLATLTLVQKATFQRDFLSYVNSRATARVEAAAVELGKRYEQVGDWRFLDRNPRGFDAFLNGSRTAGEMIDDDRPPPGPPPDDARFYGRGPPHPDLPPLPGGIDERRPLRDGPPPGADRFDERMPPNRGPRGRPPPRQTRIDALNVLTRVALLNEQQRLVIGNPAVPLDSPSVPIHVGGKLVGRLLIAPQPALDNDIDVAFVRSQTQHALLAALGVLLAALLAAPLLARWLLAPVKTLGARMEQLAAGDYKSRIESSRNDELGELARNYNRLADTLARNQEERRTWGADIAHELRTPLSILRGEIQAMQDGVRPLSQEGLCSLQAECGRLNGLVEDLYQLALADAGALSYRFETCDLNELLRDLGSEHARSLRAAGLPLTLALADESLPVRADLRRLTQLFTNLLTNSGRYTDAPGSVRISSERQGARVQVMVDDSAPGVPTELLPKLFDRLFRVEGSRNRVAGGAGLGLAICKSIAEAHGGELVAAASPLGGLRMTLRLPLLTGT